MQSGTQADFSHFADAKKALARDALVEVAMKVADVDEREGFLTSTLSLKKNRRGCTKTLALMHPHLIIK